MKKNDKAILALIFLDIKQFIYNLQKYNAKI